MGKPHAEDYMDGESNDGRQSTTRMTWSERITETMIWFPEAIGWAIMGVGRMIAVVIAAIASAP